MIYSSHGYDRSNLLRNASRASLSSGNSAAREKETRVLENVGMEITLASRKRLLVGSNRELGLSPRASLQSESYLLQASPFKNNHTFPLFSDRSNALLITQSGIYEPSNLSW